MKGPKVRKTAKQVQTERGPGAPLTVTSDLAQERRSEQRDRPMPRRLDKAMPRGVSRGSMEQTRARRQAQKSRRLWRQKRGRLPHGRHRCVPK